MRMLQPYKEIETLSQLLDDAKTNKGSFEHCAFQNIDFAKVDKDILKLWQFDDCLFLGCNMRGVSMTISDNCVSLPILDKPYNMFRSTLYSPYELYATVAENAHFDGNVYAHYLNTGKQAEDIGETLARSLHDHSIIDALHDFLSQYDEKNIVGIMGGHAMLRTDEAFRDIVLMAKGMAESGKLLVSGGGPGAMEAMHLGTWMAGREEKDVDAALKILSVAPSYKDKEWLSSAFDVMRQYPQTKYKSLGIPTWLYGHEPSTPFATHIAKLFENALREDGLLTIAKGGIVYAPGGAGTMQEIFQDATQNHYLTCGYASPMVFYGREYWTRTMPVYPLLESLLSSQRYKNLLLSITDSVDEVISIIENYY